MTSVRGALAATVGSALACLVAALLPWLRTGSASRSAFGLARSASMLGFLDGAPRRACLALWYLLPFLVAATWTAAAAGRPAIAAMLGWLVGATSVAAGSLVIVLVRAAPGPLLALAAGGAGILSSSILALSVKARPISAEPPPEGATT